MWKTAGGDEEEGVEAVEQATVAGDDGVHVVDAEVPLDGGEHEVPSLPGNAGDDAESYQQVPAVERRAGEDERADSDGTGSVHAGLLWTWCLILVSGC